MHCAACAGIIEDALAGVDGVQGAEVSAAAQRATVRWDPARTRPSQLIAAVRRAGYDAVPDAAAPARACGAPSSAGAVAPVRRRLLRHAGDDVRHAQLRGRPRGELAPDMRQLLNWGGWVLTLPVMLFSAGPFFRGAWRALRQRRIGMDVPVALGIAVTFIASTGATLRPERRLRQRGLLRLADHVRELPARRPLARTARARTARPTALERAAGRACPTRAERVAADGSAQTVERARACSAGDRVRVAGGPGLPGRRRVVQGRTQADEALLSGESRAGGARPTATPWSAAASTSARRW